MNIIKSLNPAKLFKSKFGWVGLIAAIALLLITMRSCHNHIGVRKSFYTIGRNTNWGSISLYGRDRNLTAFINDLMAEIAQEKGFQFSWVDTSSSSLLDGVEDDHYDAAVFIVRPDPFFETTFLYSDPLFKTGVVLVTPIKKPINALKDVKGKTIGIGSTSPLLFTKFKEEGANPLDVTFIKYADLNKGFEAVLNGTLDGFIVDDIPAYTLIDSIYRGQLLISSQPITDDGIRIITLKHENGQHLVTDVDEALKSLKANGKYTFLIKKWGLFDPDKPMTKK